MECKKRSRKYELMLRQSRKKNCKNKWKARMRKEKGEMVEEL